MEELLKDQLFASHAVAAACSVTAGTLLTYPLDTIKVLIQVGSSSTKRLDALQVLYRVRSLSGSSGLYSGVGWSAVGRISGVGARFGVYEIVTALFKDGREGNNVDVSEALMAGFVAGATESIVSSPFELMKLRAQVTSASRIPRPTCMSEEGAVAPIISRLLHGYSPDVKALNQSVGLLSTLTSKTPNMMSALKEYPWMMTGSGMPPSVCDVRRLSDIISLEGWGTLWRGLRSGIARDSVFGGVFFSCWQFLHQGMVNWKAVGMDPTPSTNEEVGPLHPFAVTIAAGFSGSIAAAASHCFDTAKSRSQCTVIPKYIAMERKHLMWKRPGNGFERVTGIHPTDRSVLYRGMWIRMARSGVALSIVVGGYFLVVDRLI